MRNKKTISNVVASLLALIMCFAAYSSSAQTKMDHSKMKDCCMMHDGKMMVIKDGKTMPMEKNMTMENGTTCMTNGQCTLKDGTKMQMKEGQCMDMNGKLDQCSMMSKDLKSSTEKKPDSPSTATTYTCPMHAEVSKDKATKCPKCRMDLVEKK